MNQYEYLHLDDEEALAFETRPTVRMRAAEKLEVILSCDDGTSRDAERFVDSIPNDADQDLLECLEVTLERAAREGGLS